MHLLWWILVGLVAGWATGKIMKGSGYGFIADIVLGIVGAVIGGYIAGALGMLAGRIDVWLLASLDTPRGAPASLLAAVVAENKLGGSVECFASPEQACTCAAKQAGEDDRIMVFGSFLTVAAAMRAMKPAA